MDSFLNSSHTSLESLEQNLNTRVQRRAERLGLESTADAASSRGRAALAREQLSQVQDEIFQPGWRLEYPRLANAYYHYNHPYAARWWAPATWATVTSWWSASWGRPVSYSYGEGGTVVYERDTVLITGEAPVAKDVYAEQAAAIADAGARGLASLDKADETDDAWLPLGVFAVTSIDDNRTPTVFLQLTLHREGYIAGAYFDSESGKSLPIAGGVDQRTQRAAWRIGGESGRLMEAGLYNLTLDETQSLVHFPDRPAETRLLIRMEQPQSEPTRAADELL